MAGFCSQRFLRGVEYTPSGPLAGKTLHIAISLCIVAVDFNLHSEALKSSNGDMYWSNHTRREIRVVEKVRPSRSVPVGLCSAGRRRRRQIALSQLQSNIFPYLPSKVGFCLVVSMPRPFQLQKKREKESSEERETPYRTTSNEVCDFQQFHSIQLRTHTHIITTPIN